MHNTQAVIMVNQAIGSNTIKQLTGYGSRHSYELRKKYLEQGLESIRDKQKKKVKALLNRQQREEIIHVLRTQTPKDCGYHRDGWTTKIIAELIKISYGVICKSKTSYYLLFKEIVIYGAVRAVV